VLKFLVGLILGALLGMYVALAYPHQLHNLLAQIGVSSSPPSASEPRNKSHKNFP
jgi:hypothetical protein